MATKIATYAERIARAKAEAGRYERRVAEWITEHPHMAMLYALASHEKGWHGCDCELHKLVIENQKGETK